MPASARYAYTFKLNQAQQDEAERQLEARKKADPGGTYYVTTILTEHMNRGLMGLDKAPLPQDGPKQLTIDDVIARKKKPGLTHARLRSLARAGKARRASKISKSVKKRKATVHAKKK